MLFAAATGLDVTVQNKSMEGDSDSSFDKSNTSLNKSNESDEGTRLPRHIEHKDIVNTFFTYYEVKPCKPRLSKLQKLLESTKYRGPELEYEVDKSKLMNFQAIVDQIQASQAEIDQELEKIQAIKIDEYYRLLEFDYEFRILSYMLDLIEENSWPLYRISREVTIDSLKELGPVHVLQAMFRFYTKPSTLEDSVQYYQYDEVKVCRFLASVLLTSARRFNLEEFLQAWKDSVPEGMVPDVRTCHISYNLSLSLVAIHIKVISLFFQETMLSGIALIDKSSAPHVIWGFAENELPEEINERFKFLFQTKPKWTLAEISPYIQ